MKQAIFTFFARIKESIDSDCQQVKADYIASLITQNDELQKMEQELEKMFDHAQLEFSALRSKQPKIEIPNLTDYSRESVELFSIFNEELKKYPTLEAHASKKEIKECLENRNAHHQFVMRLANDLIENLNVEIAFIPLALVLI